MHIETSTNVVKNNTGKAATAFTFILNAKTAQLLADPYANKFEAVIREICCNAHDGHIAAGHPEKQFLVVLPTRFSPELIIKDFGCGIAPDMIGPLYTTYGTSNKDDSDDFTGGLGFGSKSPFAVTKQFTVEARWHGKVHFYSMFKNEEGIPSFTEMGVSDTDEPNGLTVRVPTSPGDASQWIDAAQNILRRFNPLPKVEGYTDFTLKPVTYRLKQKGWRLTDEGEKSYAVQGNVAYPIDAAAMGELTTQQAEMLGIGLEIDFDMGEIQVPLSREAISYTPNTVANIKAKLSLIMGSFITEFNKTFDSCVTEHDALMSYNEVLTGAKSQMQTLLKNKLYWNTRSMNNGSWSSGSHGHVGSRVNASTAKFCEVREVYKHRSGATRIEFGGYTENLSMYDPGLTRFVWNDGLQKAVRSTITNNFHKMPFPSEILRAKNAAMNSWNRKFPPIIIINADDEAQLKLALDYLGNPPCTKLSDLEAPVDDEDFVPSERKKRTKTAQLYTITKRLVKRHSWGRHTGTDEVEEWTAASVAVDDVTVYIDLENRKPKATDLYEYNFDNCVNYATKLGILTETVYGVPGTYKTLPGKNPHMLSFFPEMKKRLEAFLAKHELSRHVATREMLDQNIYNWWWLSTFHAAETLDGLIKSKTSPGARLVQSLNAYRAGDISDDRLRAAEALAKNFGIPIKVGKPHLIPQIITEELETVYPLLKPAMNRGSPTLEAVVSYINLIDKHG